MSEDKDPVEFEAVPAEEAPKPMKRAKPKKAEPEVGEAKAPKPEKAISFEQWAALHGHPKHHHGGMKAFVPRSRQPRPPSEWDRLLNDY